jgi:hypothetical protein
MIYTVVQRSEVATIMVDIIRTMIDELAFVRPCALASEVLVTDGYEQVCEVSLVATWLVKRIMTARIARQLREWKV